MHACEVAYVHGLATVIHELLISLRICDNNSLAFVSKFFRLRRYKFPNFLGDLVY